MTSFAGITVTRRKTGITLLTCGLRDINWCRGRITHHGYQLALTATLNFGAIAADEVSAVEQALLDAIAEMFTHAAGMREANQPLFDLAVPLPHHQEGDPT
jgi:hypothetical protein